MLTQFFVIFDNAVVNDNDFARLIAMRVSVFLGRTPVRRTLVPARPVRWSGADGHAPGASTPPFRDLVATLRQPIVLASGSTRLRKPTLAGPANGPASRAAGRSIEIVCACEVSSVMTASTPTRTQARHAPGRHIRANLPTAELYEDAIRAGEGLVAADGPLVVRTGKHTGRSPEDKFIVSDPSTDPKIWWGPVNRPISEAHYDRLRARLVEYVADKDLYAQDCFIGAATAHRRSLRVYTETAWASIFARNLFRRPTQEQLKDFAPNFTIICVPSFQADPKTEGTRTGTAILVHLEHSGGSRSGCRTMHHAIHGTSR